MVLITPERKEREAALRSMLHPLYKNILTKYTTDGRVYYSQDGKTRHAADTYYRTVERDITESAAKMSAAAAPWSEMAVPISWRLFALAFPVNF